MGETNYKFTKKKDIIPFGKHKGQSIGYVLDEDPSYIVWMSDQENIKVSRRIVLQAEWDSYNESDGWGNYGDEWWKD